LISAADLQRELAMMDFSLQLLSRLPWRESSKGHQGYRVLPWLPLDKEMALQRLLPTLVLFSLLAVASFCLCRLKVSSCREARWATWCILQSCADGAITVIFWGAANFRSWQAWLVAILLLCARCWKLASWKQFFLAFVCFAGAVSIEIRRGKDALLATCTSYALMLACKLLLLQATRPSIDDSTSASGSCEAVPQIQESKSELAADTARNRLRTQSVRQSQTSSGVAFSLQRRKDAQTPKEQRQPAQQLPPEQNGQQSQRLQRLQATSGRLSQRLAAPASSPGEMPERAPLLSDAVRTSLEAKQSRLSGRPLDGASKKISVLGEPVLPATRVRRGGHSPRQQLMTGKENVHARVIAKQTKDLDSLRNSQICFPQKLCAGVRAPQSGTSASKIYVDEEFAEPQEVAAFSDLCEFIGSGHEEAMATLRQQLTRLQRQR